MFDFNATPKSFTAPLRFQPLGGEAVELEVEWAYKSTPEFGAWLASTAGRADAEVLGEVVLGWSGVKVEFSPQALADWLEKHPNAALQFFSAYRAALFGVRTKN